MSGRPIQPDDSRENPLLADEMLLALVEGELSESREAQVLAALASRPDLLAMVRGMRRDRVLLSDLCDVEAPAEVIEGIEAALERSALLDQPSFSDLPPAPIVMASRGRERNWSRGLAMAAAVALMAGGLGYWTLSNRAGGGMGGGPSGGRGGAPGTVADRGSGASGERLAKATDAPVLGEKSVVAAAPAAGVPAEAPADARLAVADVAATEVTGPESGPVDFVGPRVAAETDALAVSGVITAERAVLLASQGRLVLRVASRAPARTLDAMESIASGRSDRSWRLSREGDGGGLDGSEVIAELALKQERRAEAEARDRAIASDVGARTSRIEAIPSARSARERRAFFASVALTPESLASLRGALQSGEDADVSFDELAAPSQPSVDVTDTRVLWWEESPERWVPWADVPVVFETEE